MARKRKLWSTSSLDTPRRSHDSQAAAYRYVANRAGILANGTRLPSQHVSVWVDERDGNGPQLYELVNLADYGKAE